MTIRGAGWLLVVVCGFPLPLQTVSNPVGQLGRDVDLFSASPSGEEGAHRFFGATAVSKLLIYLGSGGITKNARRQARSLELPFFLRFLEPDEQRHFLDGKYSRSLAGV